MPKTARAFFNLRLAICFVILLHDEVLMHLDMDAMSGHLCAFCTVIIGSGVAISVNVLRMCIYTQVVFLFTSYT